MVRSRTPSPLWWALAVLVLPGCGGGAAALISLAMGTALGAWLVGRDRQTRVLYAAAELRRAIATGQQREIEMSLRRQLALAAAGEAVSLERQWMARAQLGALLVAEWRLDEARDVYGVDAEGLRPHLQALANFGRHELALLTEDVDDAAVAAIAADRDACLEHVPERYQDVVADAWSALEGLALVRMGRPREAVGPLERGLPSLDYNPARVIYLYHLGQAYEHIGERQLASKTYEKAATAFPGTRLASEAKSRQMALGEGTADGLFRGMLPEAPAVGAGGGNPEEEG